MIGWMSKAQLKYHLLSEPSLTLLPNPLWLGDLSVLHSSGLALSVSGLSSPLDSSLPVDRTGCCVLSLAHGTHGLGQCPQTWVGRIGVTFGWELRERGKRMFTKCRERSFIGYKLWAPIAADITTHIENRPYLERFRPISNKLLKKKKRNYFVALNGAGFLERCLGTCSVK